MEKTVRKKESILEDCEMQTSQVQTCPVSVSGMNRFIDMLYSELDRFAIFVISDFIPAVLQKRN